jgi:hypothetical protein
MGGAPQVAMRVTSQIWQIVFALQTLQVFCFCFANPLGFSFGPSQKGTICSSEIGLSKWKFGGILSLVANNQLFWKCEKIHMLEY